jgi:purine-binding chemotaxis protein CheW
MDLEMEGATTADRYLVAEAAGQRVAFPLGAVREIIPPRAVTRLPGAGDWVLGLLNLRGLVLTVVDLSVRFRGTSGESPSIVVLEVEGRMFGVQVAAVLAVAGAEVGREGNETLAAVDDARSAEGLVAGLVEVPGGTALAIDVTALQHAALAAV